MTPIASKEPSRAGTPLRARSPISSRASSPGRRWAQHVESHQSGMKNFESSCSSSINVESISSLESRARALDEAERTRFMARYKREEVKIQAWENSMTRKAEMELNMMEEVSRIRAEHVDDVQAVLNDRVNGQLKVTRAFGAGFLKLISGGIAVATYNEGATDFNQTPAYKESIQSQELLEEPDASSADVFEANPTETVPSLE